MHWISQAFVIMWLSLQWWPLGTGGPLYMLSFYLRICVYGYMQLKNGIFYWTYPLIYSDLWSFYMRIHYMWAYFWSPYLSHITRSTCIFRSTPDLTLPIDIEYPTSLVRKLPIPIWRLRWKGSTKMPHLLEVLHFPLK